MARSGTPKVGRTVTYYDSNCKPRPAVVTAVTDSATVTLRVGHSGETHAAVVRQVVGKAPNTWKQIQ